jgi:hypothetical protein
MNFEVFDVGYYSDVRLAVVGITGRLKKDDVSRFWPREDPVSFNEAC